MRKIVQIFIILFQIHFYSKHLTYHFISKFWNLTGQWSVWWDAQWHSRFWISQKLLASTSESEWHNGWTFAILLAFVQHANILETRNILNYDIFTTVITLTVASKSLRTSQWHNIYHLTLGKHYYRFYVLKYIPSCLCVEKTIMS